MQENKAVHTNNPSSMFVPFWFPGPPLKHIQNTCRTALTRPRDVHYPEAANFTFANSKTSYITQMFPRYCYCCNSSMSCRPHPWAWIVQILRQTLRVWRSSAALIIAERFQSNEVAPLCLFVQVCPSFSLLWAKTGNTLSINHSCPACIFTYFLDTCGIRIMLSDLAVCTQKKVCYCIYKFWLFICPSNQTTHI